ncbi:hypothetical protein HC891_09475 [Candidatus Gracilibacteria bacterium]|nr:hypothetical protein [Candidatus Gracilibacteria bacterium]
MSPTSGYWLSYQAVIELSDPAIDFIYHFSYLEQQRCAPKRGEQRGRSLGNTKCLITPNDGDL